MPAQYIMALDQGTTGTTVSLIDDKGQMVASLDQDFPQIFPQPGWVEHDVETIWKTVQSLVPQVLAKAKVQAAQIAAIGITNQRETVVMWDSESDRPIANAIVWQCRRTQDLCLKLKARGLEKTFRQKTGLVLDPYFSGTKIQWLMKNVPQAKVLSKKGTLRAGTIDSFLIWRLTGGTEHVTDVSNASRTLLMNLKTTEWDQDLMRLLQVPAGILPRIVDSSSILGKTKGLGFLPDGIPIAGVAGDQQSALFGPGLLESGSGEMHLRHRQFYFNEHGRQTFTFESGLTVDGGLATER